MESLNITSYAKNEQYEVYYNKITGLLRKNLYYLRKKANKITLDELAECTGISRDTLFKLENKEDVCPNLKTLLKLSSFFNVRISDLLEGDIEKIDTEFEG